MEQEFTEFRESDKSLNMNWSQFKDPVSHMCLAGVAVVFWSLTQKIALSSHFSVMTNLFVTEFAENIQGKLKCLCLFRTLGGLRRLDSKLKTPCTDSTSADDAEPVVNGHSYRVITGSQSVNTLLSDQILGLLNHQTIC